MKVKDIINHFQRLDGERDVYYYKHRTANSGTIMPINKIQTETKFGDAIFLTYKND